MKAVSIVLTSHHPEADKEIRDFFPHGSPQQSVHVHTAWYRLWIKYGSKLSIRTQSKTGAVCINCPYCGGINHRTQTKCTCGAYHGGEEHDFGYDPSIGWTRPLTSKEQDIIRKAKQRLTDEEPPVKLAP